MCLQMSIITQDKNIRDTLIHLTGSTSSEKSWPWGRLLSGDVSMQLSPAEYAQIKDIFHGSDGENIREFLSGLSIGQKASEFSTQMKELAASMGWVSNAGDLTGMGHVIAASCREYQLWLERDLKLPFENAAPWLTAEYFNGRKVVEIGSGAGANLMSFKDQDNVVGIEPMEIYKQLGDIMREKYGVPNPAYEISTGEDLPFEDDSVDLVLSVASHQYFDIVKVLDEVARVLKPGGEVFFVGKTFSHHLKTLTPTYLNAGTIKRELVCFANTGWYSLTKQRLFAIKGNNTSRPIYPTHARMRKWMAEVGIKGETTLLPVANECIQRGRKLGEVAVHKDEGARKSGLVQA